VRLADLDYEMDDGVLVARLRGEIDMSNAEDLRQELTTLTSNEALGLVLDLGAVEYLDSAGIQLIYRLRSDLVTRGQGFRLVIPDGSPIMDALRLAGLDLGTEAAPTVEEARRALSSPRQASPEPH
jgi:anti-sigma B factor antagonist